MALYDPKEFPAEAPAKVSPDFTVAEFLDWARRKPADEGYCYIDSSSCALAQFGRDTGRPELVGFFGTRFLWKHLPLRDAINPEDCSPHTFGALVQRLEALSK
jgi:hypothetical protein